MRPRENQATVPRRDQSCGAGQEQGSHRIIGSFGRSLVLGFHCTADPLSPPPLFSASQQRKLRMHMFVKYASWTSAGERCGAGLGLHTEFGHALLVRARNRV
ncbi:hypothetical protein PsYK624_109400 [Phanerochaete sordida]|uniref:Uncharacterized protein n=1 Tax=Phanerochaete sordida TaxID=48140 RepID=A0A9P3LHA8_9APHY|nr:hypothetical protein PsYK624_109400 [Phanerochaete sordida]